MKILIIGAGVAGSVLSDILSNMGHETTVIENPNYLVECVKLLQRRFYL